MTTDPIEHEDDDEEDESEEIHARDVWQIFRFLGPYARPHRRLLVWLGLALVVETIFNFSFPLVTAQLVDGGLIQQKLEVLVGALIFLGVAAIVVALDGLIC